MKPEQFEDILIYFSKSLMGKENEEDILWDIAKNCISKLGFVDCVVYLVDYDENLLVQKAAYGPKSPKDRTVYNPLGIAIGEGITGSVAKTRKPELVLDTSKDSRYIVDDDIRLSEICVPILYEDILYGVIDCEHPEKNFFTERHLKILSAIASVCAIKIKSVRANRKLIEKQGSLIQIREEMLELKLRSINSQLNPHFVFNSLNAIQYFITTQNSKSAMDYFSTFSKLVRFYLNQLGKETVCLKDEMEMLNSYLKLQKLRYQDMFNYNIVLCKGSKRMEDAAIPCLVIQTLFENIIENAMFNQQKGQNFKILVDVADTFVRLKVHHQSLRSDKTYEAQSGYRKDFLNWEDHIKLMNTVKDYNITNEITYTFDKDIKHKSISLNLPNLQ